MATKSNTKSNTKSKQSKAKVAKPKSAKSATIHIKGRADKDTWCGGSHSPIWNRELTTIEPRNKKKATCGRCLRVARSKEE